MSKITDFKPGQTVRIANNSWAKSTPEARDLGSPGDTFKVSEVITLGRDGGGSLVLEGKSDGPYDRGSYGYLLFDVVEDVRPDRFEIGDRVVITDKRTRIGHHPLGSGKSEYVGKVGTVKTATDDSYTLDFEDESDLSDTYHGTWSYDALDPAPVADAPDNEAPGRPTIDFSGPSRLTAREYAKDANSKVLKPEHQATLEEVRVGATVDAVALNEALVAAMRAATTRDGQSTARRERAKRIAHLHHIVQAVLENAIDELPAYEDGQRSRLVEDLRHEVSDLKLAIERRDAERATLTQAASDERRRLCAEVDTLGGYRDATMAEAETLRTNLSQTIREANEFEAALAYAVSLLPAHDRLRVDGFREGFVVGAQD